MYKQITVAVMIFLGLTLLSCQSDDTGDTPDGDFTCEVVDAVPKGDRKVGIDLLDLTASNSFDDNINLASQLGVEFIALHVAWTSIETSPNNLSDPGDALSLLSTVAAANNLKFSLTLRPIDLSGKTVPPDLDGVRFNDDQMIDRFKAVIDFVFTKVDPSVLLNLQIGNEIDGYDTAGEVSTFWEDYGHFLKAMTGYVHTSQPQLKVGFTGTLYGLIDRPALFNDLLENVDILGATYYPLQADFAVKDPEVVIDELDLLVKAFPAAPIYLQEVGYQSSAQNESSAAKQAAFYCNFFKAWDQQQHVIKSANLVRLNDLSEAGAHQSAGPYNISGTTFIEYLRTLGIRNYEGEGSNKQAFDIIHNNLSERGW
ncbi:hypothetical protein QQ020_15110 [Fulvivirgaceae bacterium BMA12]|uniref:Arabinogalactan endo-beta-1,4-galactanase n=1 Tax=Agaribacillus aureus TaxID=3051825 RepID=A0ABT8L6T1_9BACT|nr:hypothetical protein [Fulvivirgaceae bacterium BMA12]